MYPDVQPGQSRWAKCSASGPAALQHHLAAHAHHSQTLVISVFKGTRRKPGHIYSKPSTQHIWGFGVPAADATKCTSWLPTICLGHHKTGPCKGNLSEEPFAACLICHMRYYIGGGKKKAFFSPPPKWAFLPPCASLEINFQHLAAFSHDSARLPWPGASLILLLHQRCLYLIDPPASEREREEREALIAH